ncbi:NAD(P)H-hydrate dehydratase [Pseudoduganella danionis]|uniref:Bifunctional NAD(P)H-hydrate repair enzyme n=1 Tax=Pseudoduganella danionis TaxID=1890295 RepID=A0ABW9SSH1_9BURK|nr:NAD(P)H-hydrate dehydratase [Pseudoduganella danionis]MTW34580.1 NAD(P)H-hydrate dehydratase [Pseudoduganella danionis]
MNPLYTVAEIRAIEQAAAAALPPGVLMQRAGQAAANAALDLLPAAASGARVLVLAGPGNNGGDALEAAAHLAFAGARVSVIHYAPPGDSSPERQAALQRALSCDALFADYTTELVGSHPWSLVIDGLFGIGLQRPLAGTIRELVEQVNTLRCQILALDVPSGLDADTGQVVGAQGIALRASHTLTFIANKPGLHTADGRDYAGLVDVASLDIDCELVPPARLHLNDVAYFARHLRNRRQNSHKGSYGNVAVVGGAEGMCGAPILAARAALHAGAGRVYALFAGTALPYDASQPELMCRAAAGYDYASSTVVAGPGLGSSAHARQLLEQAIAADTPLLLDADALNLLASDGALQQALRVRTRPAVLTPHPLEAARLAGVSIGEIQADRIRSARQLAARYQAIVILKGSGTVIAHPAGDAVINSTGNAALATAGTGDVLAGLCGSLLAQGWPQWQAALAAVWLHGMAADVLVAESGNAIGLTASELIPAIRTAINRMVAHHAN